MNILEILLIANSIIGSFIAGAMVAPVWNDENTLWYKFKMSALVILLVIFGLTLLVFGIPAVLWAYSVKLYRYFMVKSWINLWMGKWDNITANQKESLIKGYRYYKDSSPFANRWMKEVARRNNVTLPV